MSITRPLAVAAFVTCLSAFSPALQAATHSVVLNPGTNVSGNFNIAPLDNVNGLQLNDNGDFVMITQSERGYNGLVERDDGVVRGNIANPAALTLVGRTGDTLGGVVVHEINQAPVLNNAGSLLWSFDVPYGSIPADNPLDTIVYNGNVIAKYGSTVAGESFAGTLSENLSLSQGGKIAHFLHRPVPGGIDSSYPFNEQMVLIVNGVALKRGGTGNSTLAGQPFYGFGQPSKVVANDAGKIAVSAWIGQALDAGLYVINGATETVLAQNGGFYYQSGSPYNGWKTSFNDSFTMNEAGNVVYAISVQNPNNENDYGQLLLKDGAVVASTGQTIDGLLVHGVDGFSLNEAGKVAYAYYNYDEATEVFFQGIAVDGVPIVYSGMVVDGRTIKYLGSTFDLNDANQLLYSATFTDGSTALLVASNVPEPTALATLAFGSALLLRRRVK